MVVQLRWAGAVNTVAGASALAPEPGHERTFVLAPERGYAAHGAGKRVGWGYPDTSAEAGFEKPRDETDEKKT